MKRCGGSVNVSASKYYSPLLARQGVREAENIETDELYKFLLKALEVNHSSDCHRCP